MTDQPMGEYPPIGPRLLYACRDCAARWTGYGSPTGCTRHNGAQHTITVQFTNVNYDTMRLLGLLSEHPPGDTPDRRYAHLN